MSRTDRLALMDQALRSAPAHDVARALADTLQLTFGCREVEVYLADYRQNSLEPVVRPDSDSIPVIASNAGRAFREQVIVAEENSGQALLHIPVSVRGTRLGVLSTRFGEEPSSATRQELAEVADQLGHALTVAEVATDVYRYARRRHRLTLAAEMQWDLLPAWNLESASFSLAGQLEPAYQVRGDNFDWSTDGKYLTIALTNGMGDGIRAAMLTNLVIQALRNCRRAGLDVADQAALADQALWSHYGGTEFVETVLLRFELDTGRVLAVDAGSPRLWRLRDNEISDLPLDKQLPLGMADGTVYVEQEFTVAPGDRLFLLTDGVFDAAVEDKRYGTEGLVRRMRQTRSLSPGEAVRAILSDLRVFRREAELDDDAVAVCLDWTGEG